MSCCVTVFEPREAESAAVDRRVTALSSSNTAQAAQTKSVPSYQENETDQRDYSVRVCVSVSGTIGG